MRLVEEVQDSCQLQMVGGPVWDTMAQLEYLSLLSFVCPILICVSPTSSCLEVTSIMTVGKIRLDPAGAILMVSIRFFLDNLLLYAQ